ncbi:hypothetical protein M408DRAFT_75828 [Serendipita vermifera MAFF 305830]|uniref:Elongation factor 1-gamma n=1 Tax=Serendipita vermifera MAFF 305830 TaxID=933852 RepID=A0A0C3AX39_SERVB|nr:hypothetical protein M408DRAFT_75828 [Serendipita vermifera MAFF 305830]
MASIGTLYMTPVMASAKKIKAAAVLSGLSVDHPASYVHYEDNKKPEFLAKFASGKIPAFEDPEGFTLFEGTAIARYVAALAPNAGLLGHSLKESALIDQWISYYQTEILPNIRPIAGMLAHRLPYSKALETHYRELLPRPLGVLDKHLSTRTYLVGERITLADLEAGSALVMMYEQIIGKEQREQFPHVLRHYETIRNHPKLKDIWGPTEYIDVQKAYTPPAKTKEAKPAAPKAAAAPKKKDDADEEDEPLVPAEPKVKNPLDDLPKSNFNLEDWKRAYSNMDTRGSGGALEWFYEKFDPEGFSVWRVDFKYPEELTQVFMSSNQIGGFFNRLEGSRKYLFGSVGVLGAANDSKISGVFILRGQDHKAVVDCAPDWESYEFKKLDYAGADKEFFEAALAWDLELDGKKWADGKAVS